MSRFDIRAERSRASLGLGLSVPLLAMAAVAALVVVSVIGEGPALESGTDCPVSDSPPSSAIIVPDVTDRLLSGQAGLVEDVVGRTLAGVPRGGRISVVPIDGVERPEVKILFNRCRPGLASNRERNRFQGQVVSPIKAELAGLAQREATGASPIVATVVAAANDPRLSALAKPEIHLLSDGLEHSAYASAYEGRAFPVPTGAPLKDVKVHLHLLRNERDRHLQRAAVARLIEWLGKAGAQVVFEPPPWMMMPVQGDSP